MHFKCFHLSCIHPQILRPPPYRLSQVKEAVLHTGIRKCRLYRIASCSLKVNDHPIGLQIRIVLFQSGKHVIVCVHSSIHCLQRTMQYFLFWCTCSFGALALLVHLLFCNLLYLHLLLCHTCSFGGCSLWTCSFETCYCRPQCSITSILIPRNAIQ